MTAEVVLAGSPDEIANLPAEQRGQMITHALIESKQWLAVATKGTDPTPIAEFKAWAATVAEMTKQKDLAAEIQQDALEMVRRAERGIGVAIRNGQEAGEIASRDNPQNRPRRDYERNGTIVRVGVVPDKTTSSPTEFIPHAQERHEIYALTDGVTDEQFEDALTDARGAGNLSRANVVRTVQGIAAEKLTPGERLNKIGDMADAGHTSDQIAKAVGVTEEYVRRLAKENGITIPADKVMRGTRRINHTKFVAETVSALEGLSSGLDVLDLKQVDPDQIEYWANSLKASLTALNRLKNDLLKELAQ